VAVVPLDLQRAGIGFFQVNWKHENSK
jgi:hypothetical protein